MRRWMPWVCAAALALAGSVSAAPGLRPGTTGHFGFVPQQLPHLPLPGYRDVGPPLLFSDNPEVVFGGGLLARARVSGALRIMSYHENAQATPTAFAWLVHNPGTSALDVVVRRIALAQRRAQDANLVGMDAAYQFFSGQRQAKLSVPPGQSAWLIPAEVQHPLPFGQIQVDMADLRLSGPADVVEVAMTHPSLAQALTLRAVPYAASQGDGAGRGLFPHSERDIALVLRGPRTVLWLASGRPYDPYVRGIDPLTGHPAVDVGNYGITYRVTITVPAGTRPVRAGLFISTGSPSVDIKDDTLSDAMWVPGVGAVRVPTDNYWSITDPTDAVYVTGGAAPAGGRVTLKFAILPPAGCNAMLNVTLLVHAVS